MLDDFKDKTFSLFADESKDLSNRTQKQLWLGINAKGPFNNFIDLAFQKAEKNSKHNNAFALSCYNLIFCYLSNENFRLHGRGCLKSTNFGVLRVFLNLNIVDVCKIFLKLRYLDAMKYVSK